MHITAQQSIYTGSLTVCWNIRIWSFFQWHHLFPILPCLFTDIFHNLQGGDFSRSVLPWTCYHKNDALSRSTRMAYLAHSDLLIHSSFAVSRQLITAAPFQQVIVDSTSYTHTLTTFIHIDLSAVIVKWSQVSAFDCHLYETRGEKNYRFTK